MRRLTLIAALDKQRSWPDRSSLVPVAFQSQVAAACDFLFDVRCFLHYRHGRDDNKLTWDAQEQAAAGGVGSPNRTPADPASWMRTYFQHAALHPWREGMPQQQTHHQRSGPASGGAPPPPQGRGGHEGGRERDRQPHRRTRDAPCRLHLRVPRHHLL